MTLAPERRPGHIENLIDKITSDEMMEYSVRKSQKGKAKYTRDALIFHKYEVNATKKLQEELRTGSYKFKGYTTFTVHEPKERIINAPYYRDKVVQLALDKALKEVYQKSFIYDTYSCLDDKGSHACSDRLYSFIRKAKFEYGEKAYFIKIDIERFFYSIDRTILKKFLQERVKCPTTLKILFEIIDSASRISDLGLPLGNTLSQISANIYLNPADQYIKRTLGIKYYVRYADDMILIVENKEKAKEVLTLIEKFINEKLNLNLNKKKTNIFPISQGINAIGYKTYATHRLLRDSAKKKIKKKVSKFKTLIQNGEMTIETAEQILSSWNGHAKKASSHNFIKGLLEKHDFITLKNRKLKIDREVLNRVD